MPTSPLFTRSLGALVLALVTGGPLAPAAAQCRLPVRPAAAASQAPMTGNEKQETRNADPAVEPGEIVFRLKPAYKSLAQPLAIEHAGVRAALAAVNVRALRQPFPRAIAPDAKRPGGVDLTLTYRTQVPVAVPFGEVRRRLLATGVVAWVEPHVRRELLFEPNDPYADSTLTTGTYQYHLRNISAYAAWNVEQGDTTVVVGVTDTGTRLTHHDLKSQIAYNRADPINGLDDDQDGYIDNYQGWDPSDNDNDPSVTTARVSTSDPSHGVPVGGTSSAATNNGRGVAGSGFKCRFLPIKIYNSSVTGGFAGYEGIVYAADHGCSVINCSWGGVGYRSQYEQDCITYATRNRDAVVVAAAGNTNAYLDFYPASYDGVLSVASFARDDTKAPTATYSYRVSLSAPGRQILTTGHQYDSAYVFASGSSFAAPLVAGALALVRAHFPALNAAQAAERVRIAADTSVYSLPINVPYRELLGHGRLNMFRALADTTLRSVRLTRTRLSGSGRLAGPYYGGDTLSIGATFRNLLAPLGGLRVALSSPTPGVQILSGGPVNLGPLATLDSVALTAGQAFRVVLPDSAAPNTLVALRFSFADTASAYVGYEYVTLLLDPGYVTLDSTAIAAAISSRGDLGYDHGDGRYGASVARRPGGANLLSEGGLLVGASSARVSDRLRSATAGQRDDDFATVQPIRFRAPLPWETQAATGIFADSAGPAQVGVRVRQRAWNSQRAGCENAVVVDYTLLNQTSDTLWTPYAGVFADWDIGQPGHNIARWDSTRRLAYVTSGLPGADTIFAALKLLSHQPAGTYAFDQLNPMAPGPVNATNGLTTAEKWDALLAAPGSPTTAGASGTGTDASHLVRAALAPLAPLDTAHVAWAILVAPTLTALQVSADSIQVLYDATEQAAPTPLGVGASRCGPGALTLTATGAPAGGGYRWYHQATGGAELPGGQTASLTVTVAATDTFYVGTITRWGRTGERTPVLAVVDTVPAAPVLIGTPQAIGTLLLTTANGQPVQFYLNGVALPSSPTDSLLVTAAAWNGIYTATVTSAAGCVSDTSNAITTTILGFAANLNVSVRLYPNPTGGDAYLALPLPARVTVTDALGRVVLHLTAPAGDVRLPVAGMPPGLYAVRILTAAGGVARRLARE